MKPSEQRYNDLTFRTEKHCGLTIEGFSRAAMQTYWRIPELKLGFDLGAQPWEFMNTPVWFVSHTHMDHLLALPAYVCRRRMMKMEKPAIFLPARKVNAVQHLLDAFTHLDHGKLPCDLIGVKPGEAYELSRECAVSVHETEHPITSVGYIVWERKKKLKEEYRQLTQNQIRDLAISGIDVSQEVKHPRVAYLGDSTIAGLDNNPDMYEADVLIMEMSFAAKKHKTDKIYRRGHIHLDDILERRNRFHNKKIITAHFSVRCPDAEIERIVRRKVPNMLDNRLILWF
ncbi:MAG: metal-dependent hydrolase [Planctomycetaceae bacterium]|jgi:ribonuclease Z|nr:metal-dependent hydrolase [Planctomycetaceae bacterium]